MIEFLGTEVRKVGPEVGQTSAFYSCIPTRVHGPTCVFWANLTPFSLRGPDVLEGATGLRLGAPQRVDPAPPALRPGRGRRRRLGAASRPRAAARLAPNVKVICAPPCMLFFK